MSWLPPIGIPIPNWGTLGNPIDLERPDPPSPWTSNIANVYYVEQIPTGPTELVPGRRYIIVSIGTTDWTVCGADVNLVNLHFIANSTPGTGTGIAYLANPNEGYPGYPREVIPTILDEGTRVFLHGTYDYNHSAYPIRHTGTEADPCWITAYDPENRPSATRSWGLGGATSYLIISDINYTWNVNATSQNFEVSGGVDHVCFRNMDITGTGISDPEDPNYTSYDSAYNAMAFPVQSSGSLVTNPTEQLIWCNVNITKNGNWMYENGGPDFDGHCFGIGYPVQDIWIVDTNMSYSSGCAIQVGAGSIGTTPDASGSFRVYVGRCDVHHISQSAIWSKRSTDCVFSQNTVHTIRRDNSDSPNSGGLGHQYGANNLWIIYNTVYNCQTGIGTGGGADAGTGITNTDVYIVGNVIYDIHDTVSPLSENWRTNTSGNSGGCAISLRDYGNGKHIVNNTFYDYDGGILIEGGGVTLDICNNIFVHNDAVPYADIHTDDTPASTTITNNLFAGTPWVSTVATYDTFAEVVGAFGGTNVNDTPDFVSAGTGNFRLSEDSAGIDAIATEHPVYDLWETMYPTRPSIRRDRSGGERPWDATLDEPGGDWDMGAYEYGAAIPPPPPDPPTFSVSRHATPGVPHAP